MVALLLAVVIPCNIEAQKIKLKQPTEIVLVLDDSSSILDDEFETMMKAVRKFPDKIDMSDGNVRVGVVTFAFSGTIHLRLSSNENDVRSLPLKRDAGLTRTDLGLQQSSEVLTQARPGARKIVMLITDGASSSILRAEREAEQLRSDNVTLMAAYIGNLTNGTSRHLKKMTNDPELVVSLENFDDLLAYLERAAVQLQCDEWQWEDARCDRSNAGQTITLNRVGPSDGYEHCDKAKEVVCPTMPTTTTTTTTTSTSTVHESVDEPGAKVIKCPPRAILCLGMAIFAPYRK